MFSFLTEARERRRIKTRFVFGTFLLIISILILFWNEGRAVKMAQGLAEGQDIVVSIQTAPIIAENNGKLVHLIGRLNEPIEILEDSDLGLGFEGMIAVKRSVEMYQWQAQHERGRSMETPVFYRKIWQEHPIDSSRFDSDHHNPNFLVEEARFLARGITLGDFTVTEDLLKTLLKRQKIILNEHHLNQLPENLLAKTILYEGGLYSTQIADAPTPDNPQIGDMRTQFHGVPPTTVSIIAQQQNQLLIPYQTQAGDTLAMLKEGHHVAATLFSQAEQSNEFITWLLRFIAMGIMFIAIRLMFLYLLQSLENTGKFSESMEFFKTRDSFFTLTLAGIFSLSTIGTAWFFHRPSISIIILSVIISAILLLKISLLKNKQQNQSDSD